MRLTPLLVAASLCASPVCAQQTPPRDTHDAASSKATTELPAASPSPQPATVPDASLELIRVELAKPPPVLKRSDATPNFTVYVIEKRPLQEIFETPPWAPDGTTYSKTCAPRPSSYLPAADCSSNGGGGGTDVLPLLRQAKRALDARAAYEEAQREIAAYCAAQPNGGREIAICPVRSAIH